MDWIKRSSEAITYEQGPNIVRHSASNLSLSTTSDPLPARVCAKSKILEYRDAAISRGTGSSTVSLSTERQVLFPLDASLDGTSPASLLLAWAAN